MPQHRGSGTFSELNPPYTSLDQVPIMANYQPPHNFTPIKLGENDTGAQSAGFFHPAQHAQCVTEGTPAHQPPPQTSAAKEADQTIG